MYEAKVANVGQKKEDIPVQDIVSMNGFPMDFSQYIFSVLH